MENPTTAGDNLDIALEAHGINAQLVDQHVDQHFRIAELEQELALLKKAAAEAWVIGTRREVKEDRYVRVARPPSYETSTDKAYPVLLVLDDWHHAHTVTTARRLMGLGRIPEMVVICLENQDRCHDFLNTPSCGAKSYPPQQDHPCPHPHGGLSNFIAFVKDELLPWIASEYRTTAYRTLAAHSYAGVFAANILMQHPELFRSHILCSPSLWWDPQILQDLATHLAAPTEPESRPQIYHTVGSEGGAHLISNLHTFAMFEQAAEKASLVGDGGKGGEWSIDGSSFEYKFVPMFTSDHDSLVVEAFLNGLEWSFRHFPLNLPVGMKLRDPNEQLKWVEDSSANALAQYNVDDLENSLEKFVNELHYELARTPEAVAVATLWSTKYPDSQKAQRCLEKFTKAQQGS